MKRTCGLILCLILMVGLSASVGHALSPEQDSAVQQLIDDAVRVSGTPGVSVAVVSRDQTTYFNSGQTSRDEAVKPPVVDSHTLYEIGSLSKAFTAVGILLLEQQGRLRTTDRIEDHLPWFHVTYGGEPAAVTIKNLLNQTSGFSQRHSDAPRGEGPDMVRKTVEPFVGVSLDSMPGASFAYSNINYNILGLVIEAASAQSYEIFMEEQVFEPLGLHETFLSHAEAIATGRMAQGHRHAFFTTYPYDPPVYGGLKPAGYIISSPHDMARWMAVHLNLVDDIPDAFSHVIESAHAPDLLGPAIEDDDYYSAGWIIRTSSDLMGHDGQTPSFMSSLFLYPAQGQGVILLTNGGNVDGNGVAMGVKSILDGEPSPQYAMSERQLVDIMFSSLIILLSIASVVELILGVRDYKKGRPRLSKRKVIMTSLWSVVAILMLLQLLNYPNAVGSGWTHIFDWNPPSSTLILFVMPVFFAVTAWYTFTRKPRKASRESIGGEAG